MRLKLEPWQQTTRRQFFADCGIGLGKIALASLLTGAVRTGRGGESPGLAANPLAPKPRIAPRVPNM